MGATTCAATTADSAEFALACLEGLFDRRALGLHDGPPQRDSLLARLGTDDFWACTPDRKDWLRHSPAMRFYIKELFPDDSTMSFDEYCRIWSQNFYFTRNDLSSARDLLLIFLSQGLRYLKRMFILEQPYHQDLAPTADALKRCFDAPAQQELFKDDSFARWVLDDWLPFHLRYTRFRVMAGQAE